MRIKAIIAGVLATSLIATGVGYAFWSDTTTFTTTATTGEFEVQFTEDYGVNVDGVDANGGYNYNDPDAIGALNPTFTIAGNGKSVGVEIDGLYPGYYTNYYVAVENTGTVPARLDSVVIDPSKVPDSIAGNAQIIVQENNTRLEVKGLLNNNDNTLTPTIDLILDAGETAYITLSFALLPSIEEAQDKKVNFNVDLNWTQFNA